jgi:hypothetical protein
VRPLIERELLDGVLTSEERNALGRVLARTPQPFLDSEEYSTVVLQQADVDLREARTGLGHSRYKDRLEALRDGRDALRAIVADPSLADNGHRRFFNEVPALANRAAVGPQLDRVLELLAVDRAGLLSFNVGPAPHVKSTADGWQLRSSALQQPIVVHADFLVHAYVPTRPSAIVCAKDCCAGPPHIPAIRDSWP